MRVEKQILSEVNRMREIMGLKLITEAAIPPAMRSYLLDILGYTEKQIDALERGADDLSDLTKISDQFATAGIKTIDDLKTYVARNMGLRGVDDVSDQVLLKFMKESPTIMDNIQNKLAQKVAAASDALLKKAQWESLVPTNLADDIELVFNLPVTKADASDIKLMADQHLTSVRNVMTDINNRNGIVPQGLFDLADELAEVSKQADNVNTKMTADYSQVGVGATRSGDDAITAALKKEMEEAERKLSELTAKNARQDRLVKWMQSNEIFKLLTPQQKLNYNKVLISLLDGSLTDEQVRLTLGKQFNDELSTNAAAKQFRKNNPTWVKETLIMIKNFAFKDMTSSAISIVIILLLMGYSFMGILGMLKGKAGTMKDFEDASGSEETNSESPNSDNIDNSLEPLPASELEGLN